jgi:hypothetical protein
VLWLAVLLLLSARSAWKSRWKKAPAGVLFFYGVHYHLQQIPIFIGQLQFELSKSRNKASKLIEYKQRPGV